MNILAIDTSSLVATVAVMNKEKLIGEYTINNPMTHSQKLMPMLNQLMNHLDMNMEDIDYIAVSRGPGSFTGIRIGIATVKGLAQPRNIPIIPISSLEGLAYNISYTHGLICPIMDARRNQVYTGIYKWKEQALVDIIDEAPMTIKELIDILSMRDENIIFLGDGVNRYRDNLLEALGERIIFAPNYISMQRASSIAQVALDKIKENKITPQSHFALVPTYLRKSEAERQYEEKTRGCK